MSEIKILKLLKIMETLRDPLIGCPWDKKQTLETIIPYSIEEIYEVAAEIYKKNYKGLKEELGDVLFQVVYLSQLAKEKGKFDFKDVVNEITNKMIFRHPHVFKNKRFKNTKELNEWWEKSKNKKNKGLLDNIPDNLPSIQKANKIQKKVSEVGFEYRSDLEAIDKIIEEANELKKEIKNKSRKKTKEELGDLIFACLDVARKLNLNPEIILSRANNKFITRWNKIEKMIEKDKKKFNELDIKKFNKYWELAKN
jgi:MazG family protein